MDLIKHIMKIRNMKTLIMSLAAILITSCQAISQEGLKEDQKNKIILEAKKASEEYYTGKGLRQFIPKLLSSKKQDQVKKKLNEELMSMSYSWGAFDSTYQYQFKEMISGDIGNKSLCYVFSEWKNQIQYMAIRYDRTLDKMIIVDYAISLSNVNLVASNYDTIKSEFQKKLTSYERKYQSQQGKK